jgi:hypothetical protein
MIDSYDVVMRSSWAPIKNYQSHVGSRTDVRPVWSADLDRATFSDKYGIDGSERALVFILYSRLPAPTGLRLGVNEANSNWICETILSAYRKKFPTRNALASSCILSGFETFLDRVSKDRKVNFYPDMPYSPTSGFSSANFLASVCDTVTVFGTSLSKSLDKSAKDAGFTYHYYHENERLARLEALAGTSGLQQAPDIKNYKHNFTAERSFFLERSTCACRDGYAGVIFLDANKLRPLPPSFDIRKHDEVTKGSSPGGADAVKRLFQQFKNRT